jgi:hypothetical protein
MTHVEGLARGLGILLAAVIAAGCADEDDWGNPTRVCEAPDGACWGWSCESDGCLPEFTDEIDQAGLPDCPDGQGPYASWTRGRFFEIVVFCDGDPDDGMWAATAAAGRLLLCDADGDCPRSKPDGRYECAGGLCQNADTDLFPRDALTRFDAEALCFAGFTRAQTVGDADLVAGVLADVDAACPGDGDDPCTGELPPYCWDPAGE